MPLSRRAALLAAVSCAAAGPTASAPAQPPHRDDSNRGGPRVDHFALPSASELVAAIRLSHNPYLFTTLYSLKLPGLRQGDVVQAQTQFEATNDLGFNVMLAHAMLIHDRPSIVDHAPRAPAGRVLLPCEFAGENITPGMHHAARNLMGSCSIESHGDAWISVLIYAASDAARPGDALKVERNYGGLNALVFRNGG